MKRIFAINILFIVIIIFSDRLYAQDRQLIPITKYPREDTLRRVSGDTSQQKDLGDVLQSIFIRNYKPNKVDTIGRKPIISFIPAIGYSLQTQAAVTLTGNIVFRSSPTSKVSSVTTSLGFTERKQFTLPIVSSIWTNNNKFVFLGDARFYIYPQSTFGLGSNSNITDEDPMRYDLFRFSEVVLRQITGNFLPGCRL